MNSKPVNADLQKEKPSFARIYTKFGIFAILIVTFVASSILSPAFLTSSNLINVMRQIVVVTVLCCGAQLVFISRGVDLSAGATMALAGVACTAVMVRTDSVTLGILVALVAGLLMGFINGFSVTKFDVPPFIITLATKQAARGLALIVAGGKPVLITHFGNRFTWIGQGYISFIPIPVVIMAICLLITWYLMYKRPFGRYLFATGGNPEAATNAGINTKSIILRCYMYYGVMAGIAGTILMSRLNTGQPSVSDSGFEFKAMIAVIIGGTSMQGGVGSLLGTVVGSMFIGILANIQNLCNVSSYIQQIIEGVTIAAAVIIDAQVRKANAKRF